MKLATLAKYFIVLRESLLYDVSVIVYIGYWKEMYMRVGNGEEM